LGRRERFYTEEVGPFMTFFHGPNLSFRTCLIVPRFSDGVGALVVVGRGGVSVPPVQWPNTAIFRYQRNGGLIYCESLRETWNDTTLFPPAPEDFEKEEKLPPEEVWSCFPICTIQISKYHSMLFLSQAPPRRGGAVILVGRKGRRLHTAVPFRYQRNGRWTHLL